MDSRLYGNDGRGRMGNIILQSGLAYMKTVAVSPDFSQAV